MLNLTYLPWNSPAAGSERPCVADEGIELSYLELEQRAAAFGELLTSMGYKKGDVLAIMLPNSVDLIVAMFGAWRAGMTVTPVNPTFTVRELNYQCDDSGAKLLLINRSKRELATDLNIKVIFSDEMPQKAIRQITKPNIKLDDTAFLIYTSGSTGQPKGVILDHSNLRAMSLSFTQHVEMDENDRALLVLPLFHVNSICLSLLSPLSIGGSVFVLERFNPETFLAAMQRFRPTFFSAVPAIFARLVELPASIAPDTSSLRFAICGAAPVSKELLKRSADRFGIKILEGYGLTEATCSSACNPLNGVQKLGSVGPALPGQNIVITDEAGNLLPSGERGEIRISGATLMRGYLGRDEATAQTIVNDYLRTGDVGIMDEDGYLFIVDRIKDMIIRGGENLYPKEIEAFIATHPEVLESAVVGAPHKTLGEVPVAYVVLNPGAQTTEADLLKHCETGLMKIKVPDKINIVEALPRNPVGKIDKPALRASIS